MNYIIDPMWFYWINVVGTLKNILLTFMSLSIVAAVIFFVGLINTHIEYDADDKDYKFFKKWTLISVSLAILFVVFYIFCPNKNSMIEMQIARYVTYENAEWTVETVKSAVDYIVQAIKSIK